MEKCPGGPLKLTELQQQTIGVILSVENMLAKSYIMTYYKLSTQQSSCGELHRGPVVQGGCPPHTQPD